jgi:hypothetical protein
MNILPFEMWTYQGYQCFNYFFQKTNVKGFKKLFSFELTLAWGNARF